MKASATSDPAEIHWERYPAISRYPFAKRWIEIELFTGLARKTVAVHLRAVDEFLSYCEQNHIQTSTATGDDIARYIGDLRQRPGRRSRCSLSAGSDGGLAIETVLRQISTIRLFFDHMIEHGLRETNPVGRGHYSSWIPTDQQWQAFLEAAKREPLRNRCMIALAYDAGLRRSEVCMLRYDDLDPAHRTLRVRAETAKNRRDRVVPYSATSGELLRAYLDQLRTIGQPRGPIFLSRPRRNPSPPISVWAWASVIRRVANRAGLPQFTTHTFRHLRLTDLARAGWDIQEIANFAGHCSPDTTQHYIHLSGRDLGRKLAQGISHVHGHRIQVLSKTLVTPEGPE